MMRRVAELLSLVLLLAGCCGRGRYPGEFKGNLIPVKRDQNVGSWRVNGEKVCPKVVWAAPGCYVLEVEYSASYTKYHSNKSGIGLLSPIAGAIEQGAQTTHHEYQSSMVPFALRLRENANYYVTATFTGDEFLPRIVEYDAAGTRIQQIDPATSKEQLDACRGGKAADSLAPNQPSKLRISWAPAADRSVSSCD